MMLIKMNNSQDQKIRLPSLSSLPLPLPNTSSSSTASSVINLPPAPANTTTNNLQTAADIFISTEGQRQHSSRPTSIPTSPQGSPSPAHQVYQRSIPQQQPLPPYNMSQTPSTSTNYSHLPSISEAQYNQQPPTFPQNYIASQPVPYYNAYTTSPPTSYVPPQPVQFQYPPVMQTGRQSFSTLPAHQAQPVVYSHPPPMAYSLHSSLIREQYQQDNQQFQNRRQRRASRISQTKIKPQLYCHRCGITETPEWRKGPNGARTLCNACGLYHAKILKKEGPLAAANAITSSKIKKRSQYPGASTSKFSSASSSSGSKRVLEDGNVLINIPKDSDRSGGTSKKN